MTNLEKPVTREVSTFRVSVDDEISSQIIRYYLTFLKRISPQRLILNNSQLDNIQDALYLALVRNRFPEFFQGAFDLFTFLERQGRYWHAQQLLERAKEIAEINHFNEEVITSLICLGRIAVLTGEYSQASKCYGAALELLDEFDDPNLKCRTFQGLGVIEDHQGDYESAKNYYDKALDIALTTKNYAVTTSLLLNLGSIHLESTNSSQAEQLAREGIELAYAHNIPENISSLLMLLGHDTCRGSQRTYNRGFSLRELTPDH